MNKNEKKHQSKPNVNLPKKFSKVRLLQILGLLSRKFNPETFEFENSWSLRLIFYASLFLKPAFAFKSLTSYVFPKNDMIQLFIGNVYNYLPGQPKFFLGSYISQQGTFSSRTKSIRTSLFSGVGAAIAGLWSLSFHFVFNHLNSKNDYRLYKVWMKLTLELPVSSDRDYRVAGLSVEENKKFWLMENRVNHIWSQVINYYTAFVSLIFSSQLFFVKFSKFYGLKKSNKI